MPVSAAVSFFRMQAPIPGPATPLRHVKVRVVSFLMASLLVIAAALLTVPQAHATDRIIINGTGCQVTEEDAIGIFLHQDLYLRIDYANTHWRFGLRNMGLKGTQALDVSIQGAQYTSPQYIIKRAGMAEMFVPYDDRSHTYYDMSFGYDRMDQMDPADLPATNGALVYFRTQQGNVYVRDTVPKIAVECRDEGIGWLCKEPGNHVRRRIQEVVVWSVFDAFNYDYIIEYTFHEDGRITFRSGASGYNLPGDTSGPHVHNGLWRVSTKLLGRDDNEVLAVRSRRRCQRLYRYRFLHADSQRRDRGLEPAAIQQPHRPESNPNQRLRAPGGLPILPLQSHGYRALPGNLYAARPGPHQRQLREKMAPAPASTTGSTPGTTPTATCCRI